MEFHVLFALSLSFNMAGSLAHGRDAGPIPAILNDDHTHKALGLCLAQRPGAFLFCDAGSDPMMTHQLLSCRDEL